MVGSVGRHHMLPLARFVKVDTFVIRITQRFYSCERSPTRNPNVSGFLCFFFRLNSSQKGTTLTQFFTKVISASRKSKGIFRPPDGIEKLLRTRSKTCRTSIRLSATQGTAGFLTFAH